MSDVLVGDGAMEEATKRLENFSKQKNNTVKVLNKRLAYLKEIEGKYILGVEEHNLEEIDALDEALLALEKQERLISWLGFEIERLNNKRRVVGILFDKDERQLVLEEVLAKIKGEKK